MKGTDFTREEIHAREKVWLASQAQLDVTLSRDEARALHDSILKTGRELCRLRETIKQMRATVQTFSDDFTREAS